VLVLTLALAATGGCTGQWTYRKPDVTDSDRERDEAECRRHATIPRVLGPLVLEGSKIVSYPLMNMDLKVYNRCMEARGYAVTGD
jgi:hypothetical protein